MMPECDKEKAIKKVVDGVVGLTIQAFWERLPYPMADRLSELLNDYAERIIKTDAAKVGSNEEESE